MKVLMLSGFCTCRLYSTGDMSGAHVCYRRSLPHGHNAVGKIRTLDPPACSASSQPTALPRTLIYQSTRRIMLEDKSHIFKLPAIDERGMILPIKNRDKFTRQSNCTVAGTACPLFWYANLFQPTQHNLHTRKFTATHKQEHNLTEYRSSATCWLVHSLILYYESNSDMQIFWRGHATNSRIHIVYLGL